MTYTPTAPIRVTGLNHWFGEGEARKQAIFDVNFQIEKGSLTVLMGPSGSGKTTLLTLMGCLRDVQKGQLSLLGHELHGADETMKIMLRRRLGFIFQAHNLHESLTATQNVLMGLQVHQSGVNAVVDRDQQDKAARHILKVLGLEERLDYLPAHLSGGQKQRVAIARALVSSPDVIFADEPTAALDKDTGMTVVNLLKQLGRERGITTVMVTHDNRILKMADRIITMDEGHLYEGEMV
ncbi:ATP-binding cassette domain-containing protein [Pseudovibrio sp. Tun.PSC04-5.I4]|uniref:ATP-binding cassette domain-containing protein n=1 Tax=Pseudovibrio sp. Tun.PSC04-5.I4 TaxID=1798213 RepID=UPI000887F860|nr:ATP-binding cassette domain-containing protein [Pseudovibrio sp. Tun.PSC04-5.I4]SDR47647.1 putative ABC transport system ATP-binding protein [Pseudovibrio sp. Tun.PSC04-5.I4]